MKKAIITGVTGQDGSYLAELLLSKGYEVHGFVRPTSSETTERLSNIMNDQDVWNTRFFLHMADLLDYGSLMRLVRHIRPDEVYNLAAQSHVGASFNLPVVTAEITGMGVIRLLSAIRDSGHDCRFYQASSSEMFGKVQETPQTEKTPFHPRSPYAVAKVTGHWATVNFRESYNMHCNSGILFNHESPRRGVDFVTKKITRALARIVAGKQKEIRLGNLDSKRDWGYAKDYVEAMWRMLQHDTPDDFVIATGIMQSIEDFLSAAFGMLDLDWHDYVEIDPYYFRPTEVHQLCGDPAKAKEILGWEAKTSLEELVRIMIEHDHELAQREKWLRMRESSFEQA